MGVGLMSVNRARAQNGENRAGGGQRQGLEPGVAPASHSTIPRGRSCRARRAAGAGSCKSFLVLFGQPLWVFFEGE